MFTLNAKINNLSARKSTSPVLILVRHGEAEHLVSNKTGGWTDTALTDCGKEQARLLAEWLKDELFPLKPDIYCSDLKRAKETAEPIINQLGLNASYHRELREKNNGKATGLTKDEAKLIFNDPEELTLDYRAYEGAESWREFHHRVSGFMEELYKDLDNTAIIVGHGGSIHMILSWWLGLNPTQVNDVYLATRTTSVTILYEASAYGRSIERLNDVSHLVKAGMVNPFPIFET